MDGDISGARRTAFQPLYAQVKALITERIGSGEWKPGTMLPNEFQLASLFNVSQGTVRKALIALEAELLIVRRQGRGTYVAQHTTEKSHFHFFRILDAQDRRVAPTSRVVSHKSLRATQEFAEKLAIPRRSYLHCITRYRILNDLPAIFERIYVPVDRMPELSVKVGVDMIDEMYVTYQAKFDTTIAHASERLSSVLVPSDAAKYLDLADGTPVLQIARVASDVSRVPVELRISFCRTDLFRYGVELI